VVGHRVVRPQVRRIEGFQPHPLYPCSFLSLGYSLFDEFAVAETLDRDAFRWRGGQPECHLFFQYKRKRGPQVLTGCPAGCALEVEFLILEGVQPDDDQGITEVDSEKVFVQRNPFMYIDVVFPALPDELTALGAEQLAGLSEGEVREFVFQVDHCMDSSSGSITAGVPTTAGRTEGPVEHS